jgi:hypothetical protein
MHYVHNEVILDTCYPSTPLQRPGALASSSPRVTKTDDEPTSFTLVGN